MNRISLKIPLTQQSSGLKIKGVELNDPHKAIRKRWHFGTTPLKILPTPERPIRKRDVKVFLCGAIPKERHRHSLVLNPVNGWLIHAIKHHIHIRHLSRVSLQKLQQTPQSEHRPTLHTRIVPIHKHLPVNNHHSERREPLRPRHVPLRDPALHPRPQVPPDRPEKVRTLPPAAGELPTFFTSVSGRITARQIGAL